MDTVGVVVALAVSACIGGGGTAAPPSPSGSSSGSSPAASYPAKPVSRPNATTYQALRTTTYTYVEYANGTKEYYNRTTDPHELHNVAATLPPATRSALHTAITAMTACHGQTACWSSAHLAH